MTNKIKFLYFNKNKISEFLFFLLVLLLPTQSGKHFFLDFSFIRGVRVDYLSLVLYSTDVIILILSLVNFSLIKKTLSENKKLLSIVGVLFFANGLFSSQKIIFLYHLLKYIELYLVFLVAQKTTSKQRFIVMALTIGASIELFLSVAQLYFKSSLQGIFYFLGERIVNLSLADIAKASINGVEFLRPYGTFSHPNSMAGFYLLIYFFVFSMSISSKNKEFYWLRLLLLFLSGALVVISFSKIAITTFCVVSLLSLFFKKTTSCKFCLFSRIVVLAVLMTIVLSAHTDPLTIQKRLLLLQHGMLIIGSHLLWGTGLGQYLYFEKDMQMTYPFFFLQPIHNSFLLFFAETGILLATAIIIYIFETYKKHIQRHEVLICALVVILTGMFDHYWITLQQNWLLLGVVFGLLSNNNVMQERG